MELFNYQLDLLESYKTNRFVLVKHSRQMGITTTIIEHIIYLLLDNKKHKITLITPSLSVGKEILNKIRVDARIIHAGVFDQKTNKIVLKNNNQIKIGHNSCVFRGEIVTDVIIDNGCFLKNLNDVISNAKVNITQNYGSIIIVSSNKKGFTYFNELFNKTDNLFKKHLIHWHMNPNYDEKWYEEIKNLYFDSDKLKCEYDLIDIEETKKTKDRLISFRLTDDIYTILTENLLKRDMSLSEYLRLLIKKDFNGK